MGFRVVQCLGKIEKNERIPTVSLECLYDVWLLSYGWFSVGIWRYWVPPFCITIRHFVWLPVGLWVESGEDEIEWDVRIPNLSLECLYDVWLLSYQWFCVRWCWICEFLIRCRILTTSKADNFVTKPRIEKRIAERNSPSRNWPSHQVSSLYEEKFHLPTPPGGVGKQIFSL